MKRSQLFQSALARCRESFMGYPEDPAAPVLIKQLEYLVDLETGVRNDREGLNDITIGIIAARIVEDFDVPLAKLLHEVQRHVREMIAE